jgi:hypothetical protein
MTQRLAMLTSEASVEYTAQAIYVNLEQTKNAVLHGRRAARAGRDYQLTTKPGDEANYASDAGPGEYCASMVRWAALEQAAAGRKILEKQYEAANAPTAAARRLE